MTQNVPLVLVDGSSYLYRAFHAMAKADLRNAEGLPTGATRTVISMLRKTQEDYPQSVIAVIFDAKGKTFRDDIFSEYKANRPPMPDDLRLQIEPIHSIIKAMGLPLIVVEGVEADDVIGTLAHQATERQMAVVVSTGDKDMAQLVNEHVTLVNTMTETTLDIKGVENKFGLPPNRIIDYLALMGDKVDNIPGVPGVGEKTALALLQGLGSLDDVYNNLDKVADLNFRGSKNMASKLEEHKENAYLSYLLATIKLDVELPISIDSLQIEEPDVETLKSMFKSLEFKSWLADVVAGGTVPVAPIEKVDIDYRGIMTEAELDAWIEQLTHAELFAFDTETTSLDYMTAKLVGMSFAIEPGKAAYVPVAHDYPGAPQQISLDVLLDKIGPILQDESVRKVGQNLKYDAAVLANHGITLRGIAHDTMLQSYVVNSTSSRHDMDSLAKLYLKTETIHFEDIAGKGAKQLTFNQIGVEEAVQYAAEDADITLRLHRVLWPMLEREEKLRFVYEKIEMPVSHVLGKMERYGTLIDADSLAVQSDDHATAMAVLEQRAHELAEEPFKLGSPKQLGEILFEKLKLPVLEKTPKGVPSTGEKVLKELALDYPLPKIIMEFRELSKLKSTYTDKLPKMINGETRRVHTSYNQAVAATGRLSSTDPNLQNIPIKTEEGRRIRQAFVAPDGYKILAADYSQIELRLMAHLSDDKTMKEAFAKGLDIHRATASEVFNEPLISVSAEQRRSAKAINFGLIYGMGAFALAKQLGITRRDAKRYIDTYFERYPNIARYMDNIKKVAADQGYVETIFGRRLYLPDIYSSGARRAGAERVAINAPMQGSAADIIKIAMINVDNWLQESGADARMLMQVHDELVFEVKEEIVNDVKPKICQLMSEATQLSIPLVVEAGVGGNWDEAH